MKTTRTSKAMNGAQAAVAWDAVWTAYTAAVRSGDAERLDAAKASVRAWHDQTGAAIPSWAW